MCIYRVEWHITTILGYLGYVKCKWLFYCIGDDKLPRHMGILINHEIRIPESEQIRISWFMSANGFEGRSTRSPGSLVDFMMVSTCVSLHMFQIDLYENT